MSVLDYVKDNTLELLFKSNDGPKKDLRLKPNRNQI